MKYSPELTKEICELIENGILNKDAAQLSGIAESTFYQWQKDYPEFSESIKKAESRRKSNFIAQIVKASETTWQAAAWYLERVYSEEFGKKERTTEIKGDGKVEVIVKDYE